MLLVVQGTDADLMAKFYKTALDVIAQELARQEESKEAIKKGSYKDVRTVHVGDFHAARAGAALLVSNKEEALHLALDRHLDGGKHSLAASAAVKDSAKLLPPQAAGSPVAEPGDGQAEPAGQGNLHLAAQRRQPDGPLRRPDRRGHALAVPVRRALSGEGRLPRHAAPAGRPRGASADFALHVPPADGPGLLPLLEPKGVVYSSSFFLDVSKIWDDRDKLFNEKQAKAIEEAGKNTGRALIGLAPDKVLKQAGARHRVVVVDQPKSAYKEAPPTQPIPAFAFVTEMRDPDEFSKSMDASPARGGACFGGSQFKLKLTEEKHGDYNIVGWRFPVDVKLESDASNIRFNFSPCFVRVRNQFVFCSTLELCHELVDLLDKETKSELPKGPHGGDAIAVLRQRRGGAAPQACEDILVTQAILDQAVTPEAAREQVKAFIDWCSGLGARRHRSRSTRRSSSATTSAGRWASNIARSLAASQRR